MASDPHKVLVIGGYHKLALELIPLLLKRGCDVSTLVRTPEQVEAVAKLTGGDPPRSPGVMALDLERISDDAEVQQYLTGVNSPPGIPWLTAGSGGKGGEPEHRGGSALGNAVNCFIDRGAQTASVSRFLVISDLDWNDKILTNPNLDVDDVTAYNSSLVGNQPEVEELRMLERTNMYLINLRIGDLTSSPAGGVELGKVQELKGSVSTQAAARVVDLLLATEGVESMGLSLVDGAEDIRDAVKRVAEEKANSHRA
ncbi:hypothetical protein C8A05DRAFT_15313 [Staphylotrichum tortipilum]|uniref:NAD(P)-binding domain-containing protein n=1 Tax=Staphylotrichum tortipilum TaxID=2831512 RepID=A0AAN6RTX9_9PEZI|nr:hypothetical protein C8A05DRAFT_15313 [Staphylotrichum longicolle]